MHFVLSGLTIVLIDLLLAFGIGLAWLVDFDVWQLWNIAEREHWIGVTLTGLAIGGVAYACHGAAHFVSMFTRKVGDEAETIEQEKNLRRVV